MAEEEVFRIVIEVKTESAETSVHRVRDELEKSEHSALELNAALELLKKGFEAVKEVLSVPFELVRDFDKVFVSTTNLRVALAGVGDVSEESFQHVQHLVKELAENSRFSQVAIRDAAVLATTYGNQGEQLEKLLQVSADYAQNQQVDIATGVARVQRAMESGNIVIQRVSQNVSQLTDASARASDVLDKLGARFKNAAKAATEGGAGGLIQFGKQFDELKEALGGIIAETPEFEAVIATAGDAMAGLVAIIETNKDQLQDLFGDALIKGGRLFLSLLDASLKAFKAIGSVMYDIAGIIHGVLHDDGIDEQIALVRAQMEPLQRMIDASIKIGTKDALADAQKLNELLKPLAVQIGELNKQKLNPFSNLEESAHEFEAAWDKAIEFVKGGLAKLFNGKSAGEDLAEHLANFRAQRNSRPTVGSPALRLTTGQTEVLSKLDHGLDNYEAHLRVIDDLEQKKVLNETQAHELRLKFAQEDLAASKSWTAGIVRAYAAAQDAAENYAQVVVDAFGVAHDSIISVLDKLEGYNKNTWRQIASDAIHAIEEIVNKLIAARILGLIGQGLAGIALGGGSSTAVVGAEARAQGGPVIGGHTYIVGEHEPELYTPRQDGYVTPLSKLAGASTQRPVVVKIVNVTDPDEIERYLTSSRGERVVKNVMGRGRVSSLGGI